MLSINKILSDINYRNLSMVDVAKILGIPYTTAIDRKKKGNWLADDIEKFAKYFKREISYYFDEGESVITKPLDNTNITEDPRVSRYSCVECIDKEKRIKELEYTIELQRELLRKEKDSGKRDKGSLEEGKTG